MRTVDFNLLFALDALLVTGNVTAAARRIGLSPSAMSRTLARLRSATGDPLLVRAGRTLAPTPRAIELQQRVADINRNALELLSPLSKPLDFSTVERTFVIRASDGFVEMFSVPLIQVVSNIAPHVRFRFAPKADKNVEPLRDGKIDLEIGVLGASAPEIRTVSLFKDRFVGVARLGHELLVGPRITPARYSACKHVVVSRKADSVGPVDDALHALGLRRSISVVVPGFSNALQIARRSDLIALVPLSSLGNAFIKRKDVLTGLQMFELPVSTPKISISMAWHPRMEADPSHRWLRDIITTVCRKSHLSRST